MLKGGTAGQQQAQSENGTSQFGSFTRPGVKTIYASPKKVLDVRILPAFDPNMSTADEAYKTSVTSYRERTEVMDPDTNSEAFTSWFYMVEGYSYFGNGKHQFLSPLTGVPYFPAGHDPVRDTWVYLDKHVRDPQLKQLAHGRTVIDPASSREKKQAGYLSKTPRRFALFNVLVEGEQKNSWENAVLVTSLTTLIDLKHQLSEQTKRSDEVVITKGWSDYFYGDITHPEHGCIARVQEKYITMGAGGNQIRTSGFYLQQDSGNEANHDMFKRPVTEAELAGRYDISDTNNVTNLAEKQEQYQIILDYLVEDGVVPLHVLESACGRYGHVKAELRMSRNPAFDGTEPLPEQGESGTRRTEVARDPTPARPAAQEPQAASAVSSIKRPLSTEDVEDDTTDAPEERAPAPTTEPPKSEAPSEKSGAAVSEEEAAGRARLKVLKEKLGSKEGLSSPEITELGTLVQYMDNN